MKGLLLKAIILLLMFNVGFAKDSFAEDVENKIQVKRRVGEKDVVLFATIKTNYLELRTIATDIIEKTRALMQTKESIFLVLESETEGLSVPILIENFEEFRERNIDYVITGTLNYFSGKYIYKFFIWDITANKSILEEEINLFPEEMEEFSTKFASKIYEFITGEYGFFYGKLLYTVVEREGVLPSKKIAISKKDGRFINAVVLTDGMNITFNPRHCNLEVLYSMQRKQDGLKLFTINRITGKTEKLIIPFENFGKAANSVSTFSPNFSPDCKKIIFSVLEENGTNLYVFERVSGNLNKITNTRSAINTSASFDSKGERIVFISDRAKKPKVWEAKADGTFPKQLTFGDGSDFAPTISHDGTKIAFVNVFAGSFRLKILDTKTFKEYQLYSSFLIEDPKWTPTGNTILFSMKKNAKDKSRIYAISLNGTEPEELLALKGNLNEPTWLNEL